MCVLSKSASSWYVFNLKSRQKIKLPDSGRRPAALSECCLFSRVRFFAILWSVACQAPLSMGFSRQEYWGWLLCIPPGDLSDPGIELASLTFPALQADSLSLSHWEAMYLIRVLEWFLFKKWYLFMPIFSEENTEVQNVQMVLSKFASVEFLYLSF